MRFFLQVKILALTFVALAASQVFAQTGQAAAPAGGDKEAAGTVHAIS